MFSADEQVAHLGAAHLAHDQPVRPHPQGVADQVAQRHAARALDVRGARDEPDDVRVPRAQLLAVFHQDDPLPRLDLARAGR